MSPALHILFAVLVAALCIGVAINPFLAMVATAFLEAFADAVAAQPLAWALWLAVFIAAHWGVFELLEQRTLRAVGMFVLAAGALGWLYALAERA